MSLMDRRGTSIKAACRKIRTYLEILSKDNLMIRRDMSIPWKFLGSDYGGWRISPQHIGPRPLVYSFGIGHDISFDLLLIEGFNAVIHAFDPTPSSLDWLESKDIPMDFIIHRYGIAKINGELDFEKPDNANHVSLSAVTSGSEHKDCLKLPVKRLRTIMRDLGHEHIDVMKMDIEGAEYDVIEDLIATDIRPVQLLVEFHHRKPRIGVEKTLKSLASLKDVGYKIFAVSPTHQEVSFILNPSE